LKIKARALIVKPSLRAFSQLNNGVSTELMAFHSKLLNPESKKAQEAVLLHGVSLACPGW